MLVRPEAVARLLKQHQMGTSEGDLAEIAEYIKRLEQVAEIAEEHVHATGFARTATGAALAASLAGLVRPAPEERGR